MNVLFSGINHVLQQEDVDYLTRIGFNIAFKEEKEDVEDPTWPNFIVTHRFTDTQPVQAFPNLKVLQITSAGFNHLDLVQIRQQNVQLYNARGAYSVPIAEYVLGKILEVLKKSQSFMQYQEQKIWESEVKMKSLYQKKAAILGTGSIGQEIAKRLQAFEVETYGFNSNGRSIDNFDYTHPLMKFSDLAKRFDIVILALPINESTHHFFNKERLLDIKHDAILVNIGRGSLIDESALIELLDTQFSTVILDVFEVEPLPKESVLWHHPKVIVTPHNSSHDPTATLKLRQLILDNLTAYIKNVPLKNHVEL